MRRARISVKPNFRPGGRSAPAGQQPPQSPTDANNTPPTVAAEEALGPSPSPQRKPPEERSAGAVGVKKAPNSSSEEASADVNNVAHSTCATTPAAVPQRRMRVSATPKLVGPKATSTPRPSIRQSRSVPSTSPKEAASASANSISLSESGASSFSSPTKVTKQSSTSHTPSSPCVPSTSGLLKPQVQKTLSTKDSPPSPQPGQVPEQPPRELDPQKCPTSESDMPSMYVKLTRLDDPRSPRKGSEKPSDKEKILRALKLKALMKIERIKDIKNGKRGLRRKPEYSEYSSVDRSKMTMRDLIYYLPNTSPMRGSTVSEVNEEEAVVPPSPKVPEKMPESEEEQEEEEEEDQETLMPKVRVAEDGSIVLDEESLTVRVQRNSNTKVVEDSTALFERGSTTTYSSFRTIKHAKSWSVRETDMFFLAISMVGTDFSLVGQLLPHRSRVEIKNKFKKEEKANGWRIDKAFRNKRPYDREFFSFLLEKVLAKDKAKGKSVKLVMATPGKRRKARGRKAKEDEEEYLSGSDADEDFDMEDESYADAEKENQDLPNVDKDIREDKDKQDTSEEKGKKKKSTRARKTEKAMRSPEDVESGLFGADSDTVNADKGDELDSRTSDPKNKRKRSKKAKEDETSVERSKSKRRRKSLKVNDAPDDSIDANEEHGAVDEVDSAATIKKRKRSQTSDQKKGKPAKEKKNTKRKKTQKGTVEDEEAVEGAETSVAAGDGESPEAEKTDTLTPAEVTDEPPQRSARQSKKPKPNLSTRRSKKPSKPETTADDLSLKNENNSISLERDVNSLKAEQHQKQAVVVLERTPPRAQNLLSPSGFQQKSTESEASMNLPASPAAGEGSSDQQMRRQRAERVKRSLTAERKKKGKRKGTMDQNEAEPDPGSSEDVQNPTVLLEKMVTEDTEAEISLDENLFDFSCLHHLDSHLFQRRPMVVLSREEVNMILNVQDQTTEEDPSVSPLDLSLNTELSFQLHCCNPVEESTEAAQVESAAEEHGRELLPEEPASSGVGLKEICCEDIGLTESGLDQYQISTPTKPEVSNKLQTASLAASSFFENSEPLIDHKTNRDLTTTKELEGSLHPLVASEDPLKFPEVVPHDACLASQDDVKESSGSLLVTPQIKEDSQASMLATSGVLLMSQDSVKIKAGSQDSVVVTPEGKDGSQDLSSETLVMKTGSQASALAPLEIKEGSQESIVATPEIKDGSQESSLTALNINERPKVSVVPAPVNKDHSQEEDLKESSLEPSEVLEKSTKSIVVTPDIKEGSQGSIVATPELKERPEESMVATPVIGEDSKEAEQAVIPSSSTSTVASSELGATWRRRSRLSKPKPNLTTLHSSLEQDTTESRRASSEKILPQKTGKDQHCNLDFSEEMFSKEEGRSQSCAVDVGSESAKDSLTSLPAPKAKAPVDYNKTPIVEVLSGASPAVVEQENVITASAEETQLASEETSDTCEMDTLPLCLSVADDLQTADSSCAWLLSSQTAEQERTIEVTDDFEELCAPAELIQPIGGSVNRAATTPDGNHEEEPTFILTLYEIPVTEAYPALASSDPVMTSAHPRAPSAAETLSSDSLSEEAGGVLKECVDVSQDEQSVTSASEEEPNRTLSLMDENTASGPGGELHQQALSQATPQETITPQLTDKAGEMSTKPETEDTSDDLVGPELEDLKPRHQSTPFSNRVSKRIVPVSQDVEQTQRCGSVSVLADHFVPVSEVEDSLTKLSPPSEELTEDKCCSAVSNPAVTKKSKDGPSLSEDKKAPARRRGKLQPKLVPRQSGKEVSSKADQPAAFPASQEPLVPQIKQGSSTALADLEMEHISDTHKLPLASEAKESSVSDPLQGKHLQQKLRITPCTVSLSRCVGPAPQDPHRVPASVDDVSMEQNASGEKVANVPSREDMDSKPTGRTLASAETKAPVRRRGMLKVKPTLQERPFVKKEIPTLPQCKLEAVPVQSISAELQTQACKTSKLVRGDVVVKYDEESNSEDSESSPSMSHDGAKLQSHDGKPFSVESTASCPGSSSSDSEKVQEDRGGVSYMVLTDIFVPVSEEMGDELNKDWLIPTDSRLRKEGVCFPKKEEAHCEVCKENPEESKTSTAPVEEKDKQTTQTAKLENLTIVDAPEVPDQETKESSSSVNVEEKLQRRHQIVPCSVRVSRCTDSLPVDLEEIKEETEGVLATGPVSEDVNKSLSKKPMQVKRATSPSFTPSEESKKHSALKEIKSEEPTVKVQKESPARKKCKLIVKFPFVNQIGKKSESSKIDVSVEKPPRTVSRTRQLTITAWTQKTSNQASTKLEAGALSKTPQGESSSQAKESSPLARAQDAPQTSVYSKPQPTNYELTERKSEDVDAGEASISSTKICEVETSAYTSQNVLKESNEKPSGSQMKLWPDRQRDAKPQVKPTLSKRNAKDEHNNELQSTPLTSPTGQRTRAARAKEESEKAPKTQIDDVSNTSRLETNSRMEGQESRLLARDPLSPKHSTLWPKVVLPRVKLQTTGSSSDSSTPTSSPVRVSTRATHPMTPPQLKKSPSSTSKHSPLTSGEESEPSKVSQFFLCDIFTKVEDED